MIQRLKSKHISDIFYFVNETRDKYEDFYITKNRDRVFIKDRKVIEKIIKYQEVYGIYDKGLQGIIVIYKEKGFRPYLKILCKKNYYIYSLLKYLFWNFEGEVFIKVKKSSPIAKIASRFRSARKIGFQFMGNRGNEILLRKYKQGEN